MTPIFDITMTVNRDPTFAIARTVKAKYPVDWDAVWGVAGKVAVHGTTHIAGRRASSVVLVEAGDGQDDAAICDLARPAMTKAFERFAGTL